MSPGRAVLYRNRGRGTAVPDTVTRWWRDERAARIDLGELDEVGVDTLLHIALEGPLSLTPRRASGGQARQHARPCASSCSARGRTTFSSAGQARGPSREAPPPAPFARTGRGAHGRARCASAGSSRAPRSLPAARAGRVGAAAGLIVLEDLDRDGLDRPAPRRAPRVGAARSSLARRGFAGAISALRRRAILIAEAEADRGPRGAYGGRTQSGSRRGGWRRRAAPTQHCSCRRVPRAVRPQVPTCRRTGAGRARRRAVCGSGPRSWRGALQHRRSFEEAESVLAQPLSRRR